MKVDGPLGQRMNQNVRSVYFHLSVTTLNWCPELIRVRFEGYILYFLTVFFSLVWFEINWGLLKMKNVKSFLHTYLEKWLI